MPNPSTSDAQRAAALRAQRFQKTQPLNIPNQPSTSPEEENFAEEEGEMENQPSEDEPDEEEEENTEDTDEDSEETTTPPPPAKEADIFNSMLRWVSVFIPIVAVVRAVIKNTQGDADKK